MYNKGDLKKNYSSRVPQVSLNLIVNVVDNNEF
jgi:hypothetical protein